MRILHYSLGLPPARSGGLTRYATDLMTAQCGRHQVSLLYPGRWQPFGGRVRVRRGKDYGDVAVYELINPLPVPLSYGVREPGGFLQAKKLDRASLEAFYEQVRPDILHLHTWMGLPAGVLDFLKEKGVKVLFTTHDYYGICPHFSLVDAAGAPCEGPEAGRCAACNSSAPSSAWLRLRGSRLALRLKEWRLLRKWMGR